MTEEKWDLIKREYLNVELKAQRPWIIVHQEDWREVLATQELRARIATDEGSL